MSRRSGRKPPPKADAARHKVFLPTELVQIILFYLLPERSDDQLMNTRILLAVSHVCRLWRFAAFGCRQLWGVINLSWGSKQIEAWMKRGPPTIHAIYDGIKSLADTVVFNMEKPT